jgi:O-antigen/teichoic acid export membrane protein
MQISTAGVLRSSGHLFSRNVSMAGIGFLLGILIVRLVGIDGLGLVTTVTTLVSNIHRFLSFRMGEVVVRNLGEALEKGNKPQSAAVLRWSAGAEGITSLLALGVLLGLAPWASRTLLKDAALIHLFWLYGLVLVGNLVYETSTGVLQSLRKFSTLARVNIVQSLLTFILVVAAFGLRQGVWMVLLAYLAGKLLAGVSLAAAAAISLRQALGPGWWRLAGPQPGLGRRMFSFAVNTNINATVNLLVRDNVPLILGRLRTQTEVGYFKLGLSIINLVMLPIEPFIWPTYAENNRTIAARQRNEHAACRAGSA